LAIVFLWQLFRRGAVDARSLVVVSSLYGVFALLVAFYFPI
jgi:cation:H+ antiporter